MNRTLLLILAIFFITICVICGHLINKKGEQQDAKKYNSFYEKYLNEEMPGNNVATIIGRAVDENEKNNIPKDEDGYYIENEENSIKIDLKMKTVDKTFQMEDINKGEIVNFVRHFDTIKFKCIKIEYHQKNGKIAKLVFEELE